MHCQIGQLMACAQTSKTRKPISRAIPLVCAIFFISKYIGFVELSILIKIDRILA